MNESSRSEMEKMFAQKMVTFNDVLNAHAIARAKILATMRASGASAEQTQSAADLMTSFFTGSARELALKSADSDLIKAFVPHKSRL